MATSGNAKATYSFGEYRVDVGRGALLPGSQEMKLRPKSFDMLLYLLDRPGVLVSKSELLNAIWSPAVVTDDVVTQCLIDIRRAIGDRSHDMIRTVPRRGYIVELSVEKRDTETSSSDASAVSAQSSALQIALALFLVAGLALAWYGFSMRSADSQSEAALPLEQRPLAVAVLPFLDLSPQEDLAYFAEGMSEEVRNLLASVEDLRVIARTSSFTLGETAADIDAIREQLDVTHVLEGSVRQSGENIRITAQLVDAITKHQIWSQTYDRSLGDVFAVQEEISVDVLEQLTDSLLSELSARRMPDPEAYRLYLQAVHLFNQGLFEKAVQGEVLMRRALDVDPDYAPAWRELSKILWQRIGKGPDVEKDIAKTVDALERALALDPDDAATLVYRAWQMADFEGDVVAGARLVEHALSLDAANEYVISAALGYTIAFGSPEDAVALGEYGIANNPLCYDCYQMLARAYTSVGRLDETEEIHRTLISLFDRGYGDLGVTQLLNGRPERALESFASEEIRPYRLFGTVLALYDLGELEASEQALGQYFESAKVERPWNRPWNAARINAWTGNVDAAFKEIEGAVNLERLTVDGQVVRWGLPRISWELRDRLIFNLRDDPRWHDLLSEHGVSSEQLAAANYDPLSSIGAPRRTNFADQP